MPPSLEAKCALLEAEFRRLRRVAVAFSGGIDSAFLLAVARNVLVDDCIAVTARLCGMPPADDSDAKSFCESRRIRRVVFDFDEIGVPGFSENPPDRCYLCKKALFSRIKSEAAAMGFGTVCEGSNADDRGDYRPGRRALAELGVLSLLDACGFTKADVRAAARSHGIPFFDKPSSACLASRFSYGERITRERLAAVGMAEGLLKEIGCTGAVRVRVHGGIARIETSPDDMPRVVAARGRVAEGLKSLGFTYVALDLGGYRTGSMNEALPEAAREGA